jgi:YD repeat-containing protein
VIISHYDQTSRERDEQGINAMIRVRILLGCALAATPVAAQATETVTYTYDAKGRLVKVVHTGTVNSNLTTTYSHDKADNRTNVTTTGASK